MNEHHAPHNLALTPDGGHGGLAPFADHALYAFGPLGRSYFIFATVIALCLLGVAWITAFVMLFVNPDAAFTQRLTPAGSALLALGSSSMAKMPTPDPTAPSSTPGDCCRPEPRSVTWRRSLLD